MRREAAAAGSGAHAGNPGLSASCAPSSILERGRATAASLRRAATDGGTRCASIKALRPVADAICGDARTSDYGEPMAIRGTRVGGDRKGARADPICRGFSRTRNEHLGPEQRLWNCRERRVRRSRATQMAALIVLARRIRH